MKDLLEFPVPTGHFWSKLLNERANKLRPGGIPDDAVMVLCVRASEAKRTDDAQPTGICEFCHERVWVSPSSERIRTLKTYFGCDICLLPELQSMMKRKP